MLSNDTDVFVLLMFYWQTLQQQGLKELWIKAGVGETTRFVPVHSLAASCGVDYCQVLPAIHSLTGCDYTSKVGTKHAAVKVNAVKYLKGFGRSASLSEDIEADSEAYLVQMLNPGANMKTMDSLRVENYTFTVK